MKPTFPLFFGLISIFISLLNSQFTKDDIAQGMKIMGDIAGIVGEEKLDKTCKYTCPNGRKPRPRDGYEAHSNGCGAYGIQIKVFSPEITKCCDTHDICYGTCNKKRSRCDNQFKKCVEEVCESMSDKKGSDCLINSQLLYAGAMALGCQAFLSAQEQACSCSNPDEL